jgi:RNA polymerase sigma factor (sigma-70 family)
MDAAISTAARALALRPGARGDAADGWRMDSRPKQAAIRVADACGALVRRRKSNHGVDEFEDSLQDACVRALQLNEPQAIQNPFRYLKRIARNLFIDGARYRARTARIFNHVDDLALVADETPGPEQQLAGKQLLGSILAEIEHLPPRCRQAFLMHRFDNISYPAISRRMGISVSMVEKHIAVAMVRLEKVRRRQEDS